MSGPDTHLNHPPSWGEPEQIEVTCTRGFTEEGDCGWHGTTDGWHVAGVTWAWNCPRCGRHDETDRED